jgi:hypothetical protein
MSLFAVGGSELSLPSMVAPFGAKLQFLIFLLADALSALVP